jgi:putative tricarboxylic transport membrane protein
VSAEIMALAIVALGGYVIAEAVTSLADPGYATVGPGVFPVIVGGALTLVGVGLLIEALRGRWQVIWFEHDPSSAHSRESGNPESSSETLGPRLRGDERTTVPFINVALIGLTLTFNVMLLASLGFVIASAVLFACVALAFGSRRFVLDAVLGLILGGAIYLAFVHGLGLHLPAGDIWGSLPWMR